MAVRSIWPDKQSEGKHRGRQTGSIYLQLSPLGQANSKRQLLCAARPASGMLGPGLDLGLISHQPTGAAVKWVNKPTQPPLAALSTNTPNGLPKSTVKSTQSKKGTPEQGIFLTN